MHALEVIVKAFNRIIGDSQHVQSSGNALHTLNEANAAIHNGQAYHLGVRFDMAPDQVAFFAATPNSYFMHWNGLSLQADTGPVDIDFYSGTVVSSSVAMSPFNRRFDISSSCSADVVQVMTLTTTGTLRVPSVNLATPSLGGRDLPKDVSGLFDGFVLNRGDTYAVGLKNTSTDSATIWANFEFFEPDNY